MYNYDPLFELCLCNAHNAKGNVSENVSVVLGKLVQLDDQKSATHFMRTAYNNLMESNIYLIFTTDAISQQTFTIHLKVNRLGNEDPQVQINFTVLT